MVHQPLTLPTLNTRRDQLRRIFHQLLHHLADRLRIVFLQTLHLIYCEKIPRKEYLSVISLRLRHLGLWSPRVPVSYQLWATLSCVPVPDSHRRRHRPCLIFARSIFLFYLVSEKNSPKCCQIFVTGTRLFGSLSTGFSPYRMSSQSPEVRYSGSAWAFPERASPITPCL